MRYNIKKKNSTKSERIVYEILKELHVPFKHRWILNGREVDFLVGKFVIEIDGHAQDQGKNLKYIQLGYVPIHFSNSEVINNRESIKNQFIKYGINTSNSSKRSTV